MWQYAGNKCDKWKRKYLKKNLETVSGKYSTDSLPKAAVLGTSHTIRKVLQSETLSQSGGDRLWFKKRNAEEEKACDKRKMIIKFNSIRFGFICVLNEKAEGQLQKQHELHTIYTSNS